MDLASGDQAMELIAPWRWLTCFMPLMASVQTKMLFCEVRCQSPSLLEQLERKASCLPSGDQVGWCAVQAPGRLLVTSPMVSGEMVRSQAASCAEPAGAMPVMCSSAPRGPLTVHARVRPSGEMATEVGVRTRPRLSRRDSMRGSAGRALGGCADCVVCEKA